MIKFRLRKLDSVANIVSSISDMVHQLESLIDHKHTRIEEAKASIKTLQTEVADDLAEIQKAQSVVRNVKALIEVSNG